MPSRATAKTLIQLLDSSQLDVRMSWNPKVSVPSQTIANTEGLTVVLILLCVLWGGVREQAPRDQQVDLSKTEAHTEAPMTQLGRAAASNAIIYHVWFVKKLSELETQRTETTNSDLVC